MIGSYIAVDNLLLNQIIKGDKCIFDIDPTQYQSLDIDKSWQCIQHLLCKDVDGGESPMGYVVPIRDVNKLHCGNDIEVFYITAQQVKEASDYLTSLDDNTLESMYDFRLMQENGIYPPHGNESESGFYYEYIYSYLIMLRKYFKQTAEK